MVLTTTSQWTRPFINSISTVAGGGGGPTSSAHTNTSPSSSSSSILYVSSTQQNSTVNSATTLLPTACKPGSVLGLKSCSLSKPPSSSSSSIAHLDLHTDSLSRRLIEAIVPDSPLHHPTYNTRSAGSFRLIDESFSWVVNKKDNEGKPMCALPLCTSMTAPVVPIRAGRWSFEEKPTFEVPWCTPPDTHVASAGAGKFSIGEKPICVMPPSTSMDSSAVPTRASKSKSADTLISDMACSTSLDTPATSIRADQRCIEGKPISDKPFSASNDTFRAPSTKLDNEGEPMIPSIPFSSACEASIAPIIRAGHRFNTELEGDITAADVDLLPMPSLVSLASPLYDSYLSVSPTDSRMTRISSSDYLSTANSTSNSASKVPVPNYLGLPPEFLQEVDGKLTCCKVPIAASREELEDLGCPSLHGGGAIACPEGLLAGVNDYAGSNSTMANPYPVSEDDNFAESQSLAGLWSTHDAVYCDNANSVLHGSEGLASILTDLRQKDHAGVAAQSGPCSGSVHVESCIGSDFMMDELDYLMMPAGKLEAMSALEATPYTAQEEVIPGTSNEATRFKATHCKAEMEMHPERLSNAVTFAPSCAHFEGKEGGSSVRGTCPCESSQGSSILAAKMAPLLQPIVTSQYGNQSLCTASFPRSLNSNYMANIAPPCLMIGKKRPLSVFDHLPSGLIPPSPSMFNPNFPHLMARQSNSMQQETLECKAPEMSYTSATQAFSAMLYKAQGGGAANARPIWAASQVNDSGEGIKTPPSKARRRHGTAMDPQSIAARTRREKFSDRIRILQSLVPNGERLDTVSMLGQTLEYVRFLQHQVWQLYHGMDPATNIKCEKWKDFLEPTHEPPST